MIVDRDTWIVLANATHARICARNPEDGALRELVRYEHPQSRWKGSALASDRPGHVEKTEGSQRSGTALTPRSDPRRKTHRQFARELASHLEQAVQSERCTQWVLMASNPFLGEMKSQLSPAVQRALRASVPHDLTGLDAPHLRQRLTQVLADLRPS
jgi:protein required for attachment to host cells